MQSRTAALLLLLLSLAVSTVLSERADARAWPIPDSAEVTVMSPDSLELVGYLYWPKDAKNVKLPVVLLLHQRAETHAVWKNLTDQFCGSDLAVFALDLRGYGYSIYDFRTKRNRPTNTFYIGEQLRYPEDIRMMMAKLFAEHGRKLDSTKIVVIGAELGANAGLIYAADDPRVGLSILISPGLEYTGLTLAEPLIKYGERPLFMITNKYDTYSMESLTLVSDLVPRVLDVMVYDSYRYGNDLVNTEVSLPLKLLEKIRQYLR